MKDNPRHWIAEKLTRRQPPLGTHEPNKPELCYPGEKDGHFQRSAEVPPTSPFTPELELELLTPYVNFLKSQVEHDVVKVPTGVIFEAPVFQEWVAESRKPDLERLEQIRKDLSLIALSAKYSGNGEEI